MKFSFSTLGCPGWSWKVIFSSAKDIGMDGIEIRCIGNELYAPDCAEFSDENAGKTMEMLAGAGMTIPVLDSNAVLGMAEKARAGLAEAKEYIDLAARIGTPYVRVMCIGVPQPEECDLDLCAKLYGELCEYGAAKGVQPLMETNGMLGDTKAMMEFMARIPSENKGVLWDIHHPYRYFGESAAESYERIAPLLRHVHVKDSMLVDGKVSYKLLGKGDVPVKETLRLLKEKDFDGFVSLEWVKKWNPELEEAGIVLPQFANYVRRVIAD